MEKNPLIVQDDRLALYRTAVEKMLGGEFPQDLPVRPLDDIGCLGELIQELAASLERRTLEQQRLDRMTASLNGGLMLEDILENLYRDFSEIIPYNRIGLALLEQGGSKVRSVWGKSDQVFIKIERGYTAPLAGSSLEKIIHTGQPRIINDLLVYLKNKPQSESTRRIVAEGIRSSFTCPLTANGSAVGFLFFSSIYPNTYSEGHVEIFKKIAGSLSISVEKGRLVSELAASKAAIESQHEELRRLNEVKNNFLEVAAHDLRSPLSQIQLASKLLMHPEPWLSEEERSSLLKSWLSSIEQSTRHMLDLLNELLDASEIESGRLDLKFETVEMKKLLEELAASYASLAANKGVRIILEEVPDAKMAVDPARLTQALDTLIANAIRSSPPDSAVCIRGEQLGGHWIVSVQDEGPGFEKEEREALFRDLPGEGSTKAASLGLAIARRVIEAHSGEIGVDSQPGKGSRFWIKLPY